jgi:hypothetical protein
MYLCVLYVCMIDLNRNPYRIILKSQNSIFEFHNSILHIQCMVESTAQVPFRITDIDLGFQEAEGLIRYETNRVVIEYRIKDALGISFRSDVQELTIGIEQISSLEIKDWWVTMRLVLSVKSMRLIEDLPNSHSGEVTMKIARKHRKLLQDFVSNTRLALSEYRLNQLEE